jgi:hypothetical protein
MPTDLATPLPWWIAGPVLGSVIVALLGLGNKRFGVLGGVTDIVAAARARIGAAQASPAVQPADVL